MPLTYKETAADTFFERHLEERAELIEGLLREGQLAAFAGAFGVGKSPVIADLTVRFVHGLEWCGRRLERRPVIIVDCETAGSDYRKNITVISARLKVPVPAVPDELDVYLERDHLGEPGTASLLTAVSQAGHFSKLDLIEKALERKPNAVVFIDPMEMLFRLDTTKKPDVLGLYHELRVLLSRYQSAAIVNTFNLRKKDRRAGRSNLLSDPRDWLEEVCGSLDLLNRSDVRLGIDIHLDDVRVINGVVRGRDMQPILIRPFLNAEEEPAGFEQVTPDRLDVLVSFTEKQRAYWGILPHEFRFEEVAGKLIPRSSLSRLVRAAVGFGALVKGNEGEFRKVV